MGGWVSSPDESSSSRADNQLLFCIHVQMQFNINGALTPWGPAAPGWGRGGGGGDDSHVKKMGCLSYLLGVKK